MKKRIIIVGLVVAIILAVTIPVSAVWSADTGTVSCTVTAELISVSVTDGQINYGVLKLNQDINTQQLNPTDAQTATNTGTVNVDFNIMSSNAIGGTTPWILGSSKSTNQFIHMYSTDGPFTNYLTGDYQELASDVMPQGTQTFNLLLGMPTSVTDGTAKTITVTVQAVAHTQ